MTKDLHTGTKNTLSVHWTTARADAHSELVKQGWVLDINQWEFHHPDGRRGRLAFTPDLGAPLENNKPVWVREVKLKLAGPAPTLHQLRNRISTVEPAVDVVKYW